MILPTWDRPRVEGGWPAVTIALVAINVGIFAFTVPGMLHRLGPTDPGYMEMIRELGRIQGAQVGTLPQWIRPFDLLAARFGFIPGAPSAVGLFTTMFLHGGVAHLLGNMLYLGVYGPNIERRLGGAAYAAVYVATGVIATATWAVTNLGTHVPVIGASGAISGVLGVHFALLASNRTTLAIGFPPVFFRTVEFSSRAFLAFFVVVDNLLPLFASAGSTVAYGAHLGGFAAGLGLGAFLRWREHAAPEPEEDEEQDAAASAALAHGRELARAGMVLDAWHVFGVAMESDDATVAAAAREAQAALSLSPAQRERIAERQAAPRAAREDTSRPL